MSGKPERAYIDFYGEHKISPVAQDISDFKKHSDRREFLYRRLGIAAALVKGKAIIEFGPGSGHNALYTYSLDPAKYVMVDGNDTGLAECKKLFSTHYPKKQGYEFVKSLIEEYETDQLFDIVICEALIPAQENATAFCQKIARFTKPGGVCIITCHDVISYFSELLRCLIGAIFMEQKMNLDQKVDVLLKVFDSHLNHLKGMSRSHRDWVIDNVIHKSMWQDSNMFSINEAILALQDSFDVYGSSPYFITDWRWYKDVHGESRHLNQLGQAAYWENLHNFFDYRQTLEPRDPEANKQLYALCMDIWKLIASFGKQKNVEDIKKICVLLGELERNVKGFSAMTADSIASFNHVLKKYPDVTPATKWGNFEGWWGRGMQYLSFIRNQ